MSIKGSYTSKSEVCNEDYDILSVVHNYLGDLLRDVNTIHFICQGIIAIPRSISLPEIPHGRKIEYFPKAGRKFTVLL